MNYVNNIYNTKLNDMFKLFTKYIQSFVKTRNKFIKNDILSILLYLLILFVIDYSGIMNLYGQNFIRRWINMFRRIDPLNYEKKLKPFCKSLDKVLDNQDVERLQSIRIPESKDVSIFTRKNTTTHQCCENFSDTEKSIITEMSEKIRKKYEDKIGKPLYYLHSNKATIYRYHGNTSQHLWHVDPQNLPEIYNIIVCIKKVGNISPLDCKDVNGEKYSIHFNEGDAAIFNGGTTIHQVPPNDDPNSERTVLSIAFTSDPEISNNKNVSSNMCTYIEGGNNVTNIIIHGHASSLTLPSSSFPFANSSTIFSLAIKPSKLLADLSASAIFFFIIESVRESFIF